MEQIQEQVQECIYGVETINTEQLGQILQVGRTKATEYMLAIKSISDTLVCAGLCHKQDYEAWLAYRKGRTRVSDREEIKRRHQK